MSATSRSPTPDRGRARRRHARRRGDDRRRNPFADEFADGAIAHDRDGTFATEHLDRLRAERVPGCARAGRPRRWRRRLGPRRARGHRRASPAATRRRRSASTCTSPCVLNVVRAWRIAVARGDERQADAVADGLRFVTAADVVFATAVSEPSPQDLTRPSTTATRVEDGWAHRRSQERSPRWRRRPRCSTSP